MAPIHSFLLALGSLASIGAAWYPDQTPYANNTLITFQKQGCYDTNCGFVYHNFQPQTCAVTITRKGLNISEAIAAKLTLVKSGLLIRNETGYPDPTFVAWDEGPDSNADGPLQCGTAVVNETVSGESLCISAPDNHNYHGFSYWRPGQDKTKRSDIPECTGEQYPDGVMLNGKMYNIEGIPDDDKLTLLSLVLNGGGKVSVELDVYLID
ncbi:hypothetical protein yc1106_02674 [Curvularia clavata]|uniref:Uncharacterized protein n=1 Tax=Curvularia clavata TaxID=95742 RepID=A0A9Q9DQT5_CURCL|nr:hypothetical protein yc1106_02674 [Curvularia clavata]